MSPKLKEEKELTLYPCKKGKVYDLLQEAKKEVELMENGTGQLRLFEMSCFKISYCPGDEVPLDHLNQTTNKTYRIEEVTADELNLMDDEILIPVAHFSKDVYATFGTPFVIKVKYVSKFNVLYFFLICTLYFKLLAL